MPGLSGSSLTTGIMNNGNATKYMYFPLINKVTFDLSKYWLENTLLLGLAWPNLGLATRDHNATERQFKRRKGSPLVPF